VVHNAIQKKKGGNPDGKDTRGEVKESSCSPGCDCDDCKESRAKKKKVMKENHFAAHFGKDTDPGAKYAKPSKGGSKKGVYTMKGKDGKPLFKEDITAEDVASYLMEGGFCNNPVSAEVLINNMSDAWLEQILGEIEEGYQDPTVSKRLTGKSPAMRAMNKSDELQKTEPGSKRQKMQTKRSEQLNRIIHSGANMARRKG